MKRLALLVVLAMAAAVAGTYMAPNPAPLRPRGHRERCWRE